MSAEGGSSPRVLVVEDDEVLGRTVVRILEEGGLPATVVRTGGDALRAVSERRFELVLLDVGLPDRNGLDVLAEMRRMEEPPRVIMLTADRAPETVLRAAREQAWRFVPKPVEAATLLEVVRHALDSPLDPPIEVLSASPEWVELALSCTRISAERIQDFVRHLDAPLSSEQRESVGQAFRELLLNAVEWGGKLDPGRRVRISCIRGKRVLQYRISDPGAGFRFEGIEHAAINNPPDDPLRHHRVREELGLRPGGLGLLLVRAAADELLYNEDQNEVIFIKYLDA
jgi:two-component system, OmpR family, response regulator